MSNDDQYSHSLTIYDNLPLHTTSLFSDMANEKDHKW